MDFDGWFLVFVNGQSSPVAAFPSPEAAGSYRVLLETAGRPAWVMKRNGLPSISPDTTPDNPMLRDGRP